MISREMCKYESQLTHTRKHTHKRFSRRYFCTETLQLHMQRLKKTNGVYMEGWKTISTEMKVKKTPCAGKKTQNMEYSMKNRF